MISIRLFFVLDFTFTTQDIKRAPKERKSSRKYKKEWMKISVWKRIFIFIIMSSSLPEGISDFASILRFILRLKGPVVSWVDSDHVRMLMRLFSVKFILLTHSPWSGILIFRKYDICLARRFFFLGIGPCYYALSDKIMIYFTISFLIFLKAFVHFLNDGIIVSGIVVWKRLVLEFGFRLFAFFIVDWCRSEVMRLAIKFMSFGFNSEIVRFRTFLCVRRLRDLDKVRGFQWVV